MKPSLRFVVLLGVVNLFSDMTYEGGRGEVGAFLGSLGASGLLVGIVAGGGELIGYAVRVLAGMVADRSGRYWPQAWVGYAVNLLSVPALALAGTLPLASTFVVGERFGRGVRKPVTSSFIARAGKELGGGWAFGLNETLDQVGATVGPLIVAVAVARGGFHLGFGVLIVPAVLAMAMLVPAMLASRNLTPERRVTSGPLFDDPARFRRYAIGGALIAAGYVDFALIAYRFARDHVTSVALISVWFAGAMALAAVASGVFGKMLDRYGNGVVTFAIVLTTVAVPLAFFGSPPLAIAGAVLWGAGTAVQDALLAALVAQVINAGRRATAFGIYDLIFGVAWFLGSVLTGFLVDRSLPALVAFSVVAQLIAIPFFTSGKSRAPASA